MPYQALDALPLAAEPFAAAVDLVFSAIAADFTRGALIELLRIARTSRSSAEGRELTPRTCTRSIATWSSEKYLGDAERLAALAVAAGARGPARGARGRGRRRR